MIFLLTRANAILSALQGFNLEDYISKKFDSDSLPMKELEFKHLVYDFDPNLPLNDYLRKAILLPFGYIPDDRKICTLIHYIEYFLSRVDDIIE